VEQATPGDAGSRAENPRAGPTGRTRAGGSRAGMLAEPKGARARNAWGGRSLVEPGRRRPAARTAPRVRTFKFRSVCQSVELRMNLDCQPALQLGESGRRRPAARTAPRDRTFKFRSVCQSVELRMNLGRQPALQLGEPGRRRPVVRTAPRVRTFKFRSVCQSGEPRMNLGLQPAQAGHQDDDSRRARGEIF
jgi:hypothetical protein